MHYECLTSWHRKAITGWWGYAHASCNMHHVSPAAGPYWHGSAFTPQQWGRISPLGRFSSWTKWVRLKCSAGRARQRSVILSGLQKVSWSSFFTSDELFHDADWTRLQNVCLISTTSVIFGVMKLTAGGATPMLLSWCRCCAASLHAMRHLKWDKWLARIKVEWETSTSRNTPTAGEDRQLEQSWSLQGDLHSTLISSLMY